MFNTAHRIPQILSVLVALAGSAYAQTDSTGSPINTTPNHTVIFVHGRSPGTNHGPYQEPFLTGKHACNSPGLTGDQKRRCLSRIDINGYWRTLGVQGSQDYFVTGTSDDFREFAGDCLITATATGKTCKHRQSEPNSSVMVKTSSLFPYPTTYYVKNAVFVGYDGDSDPKATGANRAITGLDHAMWDYCSGGNTCTIVCHSAGCLAVGYYLANGWGPGNKIHMTSGLKQIVSIDSAAGGSQLALKSRECHNLPSAGVCDWLQNQNGYYYNDMVAAEVPSTAMGCYTHGTQLDQYASVPTYLLAGRANSIADWQKIGVGWAQPCLSGLCNNVYQDGAVTSRSQCAGPGTDDTYTGSALRSCRDLHVLKLISSVYDPNMNSLCKAYTSTHPYGPPLSSCYRNTYAPDSYGAKTFKMGPAVKPGFRFDVDYGYDSNSQMYNVDHSKMTRVGVQWMLDRL